MEKVLITGGAGFIGSHLCDYLIKKGFKVVCVDNLITGSQKNIEHLLGNPNFRFIESDVCNPAISYQLSTINYLFHLASPASPVDYQNLPEETALTNSVGTLNMLKLARKLRARFLLASTSEVYGDPKEHPQKESYWGNVNSFGPRACYDEGKRFAETLSYIYLHKYDLDVRVGRIFNTYGPRMRKDDGRVISNFINQALEGEPFTIYGDGSGTRSFCYVSDMVSGLLKLMFKDSVRGEIVNIGNPEEYKITDLAQEIANLTGVRLRLKYLPPLPDDPQQRQPDISKAKKILGWEPKVSLNEGLKRTIEYYQSLKE